ncbi:MAG: histidine phosphatase family protein [Bacillota bacterium]
MSPIYLIRHAEVHPIEGLPAAQWPLTERGRQQAEAIAGLPFWGEVRAVYSSPEAKAMETVAPAARRYQLPVTPVDDLRELERTPGLHPDYHAAVAACFAEPERSCNGGWEPAGAARRRITEAIAQIARQEGPVAVVSHGLVYALFLAGLNGCPAPTVPEWRAIPMPGWAVVDLTTRQVMHPFSPVV